MRNITSVLAVGPLSNEIIEAVFRYSQNNDVQMMLIASKNQIDYSGGYVNNWTTCEYVKYLISLKIKYPSSDVLICRDHCGPLFNGIADLQDSYRTTESDIENNFDLIHFDFCHLSKNDCRLEAKKLIEYATSLKTDLMVEIGTDENTGTLSMGIGELREDIEFFMSFCNPQFYVVQTGSLVKGINQAGKFNFDTVSPLSEMIHSYGLKLKEHNADYLSRAEIETRVGLVDSMNIAPQLGVVQTLYVLAQAKSFGVDPNGFLEKSYSSNKWNKWFEGDVDKVYCSIAAGHYNFTSSEYLEVCDEINKSFDLRNGIIDQIVKIIDLYIRGMSENGKETLGQGSVVGVERPVLL